MNELDPHWGHRKCIEERDALRVDCMRLQQEINCLRMEPCQLPHCVKDRDALRAELVAINKGAKTTSEINKLAVAKITELEKDRDRLKALAEGCRKKLEHIAGNCECCPDMISMGHFAHEALRLFDAGKGEQRG